MKKKTLGMKWYYVFFIGLFSLLLLLSGCTSVVPPTDENLVTQVVNEYIQAINSVNREKALSCTIPGGPAYETTNKFFDTKVLLAEENNTQYKYTIDIQTVSILSDTAQVELAYTFELIGTTGLVAPTFNGTFALNKLNGSWLLYTAPLAS